MRRRALQRVSNIFVLIENSLGRRTEMILHSTGYLQIALDGWDAGMFGAHAMMKGARSIQQSELVAFTKDKR